MDIVFSHALYSREEVFLQDGPAAIQSSTYPRDKRPISMHFGPAMLSFSPDDAIALGNALIRAAHHRQATLAADQQSQAKAAEQPEGGVP